MCASPCKQLSRTRGQLGQSTKIKRGWACIWGQQNLLGEIKRKPWLGLNHLSCWDVITTETCQGPVIIDWVINCEDYIMPLFIYLFIINFSYVCWLLFPLPFHLLPFSSSASPLLFLLIFISPPPPPLPLLPPFSSSSALLFPSYLPFKLKVELFHPTLQRSLLTWDPGSIPFMTAPMSGCILCGSHQCNASGCSEQANLYHRMLTAWALWFQLDRTDIEEWPRENLRAAEWYRAPSCSSLGFFLLVPSGSMLLQCPHASGTFLGNAGMQ